MKKVITYGTFDLFHQGHYNIIKRAKEYGDYLIVGVTSESYDIERGKLSVHDSLLTRIENVKKTGLVDEVIVEEYLGQKTRDIIQYNIDTLVVGSDWIGKFDHLRQYCNVVYLERTKNISSTQLREKSNEICKFGVITDNTDDLGVVKETKYVSGIHIERVYSDDIAVAEEFCNKYELNSYSNDFDKFVDDLGIVYIKSSIEKRYDYIKKCIEKGLHIICDFPFSYDNEKCQELNRLAKEKNVALMENIVSVYLRAFTQFLWIARCGEVGKVLSVNIGMSSDFFKYEKTLDEMSVLAITAVIKLLGTDAKYVSKNIIPGDKDDTEYCSLFFRYDNSVARIEIGKNVDLHNHLTVIGTNGSIVVEDDWWNTGYFKVMKKGVKKVDRRSFNFEGTGFRYLIQELQIMLRDKRYECNRLTDSEGEAILKVFNQLDD
ncbi:MAG: adenylyltransferase/cytidyltransferase family protein [Oscillospiraceae bacterium]|nr:adenylyltransferase/cytidyltransferase family protein [Oscillospiraceae bacterium]